METELTIEKIDQNSLYLESVIALGVSNSKSVGHMPRGGFIDHASKGLIIIAKTNKNILTAYLMYRISYQKASIVHLCVNKEWRKKGIAKKLVDRLIQETKDLYGIQLSCRRDFGLERMWSSFGFVARTDRVGKNKDGNFLTVWQLDHDHPPLLKILIKQQLGSKLRAVIDANIFYDLNNNTVDRNIEDSDSLLADWLQTEVELCLTDEIDNEISRYDDKNQRDRLRQSTLNYIKLPCDQEKFEKICNKLKKYFSEEMSINDESDLRHLARAIASEAQFFITRDGGILKKEQEIYEDFKISILRPSDLIIRLDELHREAEYQPTRLSSTSIKEQLVKSNQQNILIDSFLSYNEGEKKKEFQRKIRNFISKPDIFECIIFWDEKIDPLAFIVYERINKYELKIPVVRIRKNSSLSSIIFFRHLILYSIKKSVSENRIFTLISDTYLEDGFKKALRKDYFNSAEDEWIKVNISCIDNALNFSKKVKTLPALFGEKYNFCFRFSDVLEQRNATCNIDLMTGLERMLYPAKIDDAEIPTFVIPIRPEWAENLFDTNLARQNLFGAIKELVLSREVVFYRKIKNSAGLESPGRILWYVSQGKSTKHYFQVKSIRACSYIERVVVNTPKLLFREFRRLGVYEFGDLLKTADNDIDRKIMAIQFSDTELFRNPIDLNEIREILGNKNLTFPSPYKISKDIFKTLYIRGTSKGETA